MRITQAVIPIMIAQRSGHIINMSSVAGWIAAPMYSVYAASKFGVRGFTDGLRRELKIWGVQVSGIYPGPAHTEFGEHTGSKILANEFNSPSWTYMTSEYVARQVISLAKYPRRTLIIPWWFRSVLWADANLPGFVDWIVTKFFVEKFRKV